MRIMAVVSLLVLLAGCGAERGTEEAKFLEIPVTELQVLSVNHDQGGISWAINGEHYFYYVSEKDTASRIIATSALSDDIRRASTVQIKHVQYGLHRRIVNLLLFYGERRIPEELRPKPTERSPEKVEDKKSIEQVIGGDGAKRTAPQ